METQKRKPVRSFFKSFVDVKRWMSYDELSTNVKSTLGLVRMVFSRSTKQPQPETYEESVARLNLTEEQLISRKKVFLYSALIYSFFAIGLFIYFIYLVVNSHLYAAAFDLILTGLITVTAYHEHLWYMQMQKRKLGCTFHDWLDFILQKNKA